MGSSGRRRAAKALSQAQALQPFAGAVKQLPTESSIAGLAAVQGDGSQSSPGSLLGMHITYSWSPGRSLGDSSVQPGSGLSQ